MIERKLKQAGAALLEGDRRAHALFKPHVETLPVQALDRLGKLGDQPELRIISGALIVAGALFGNRRLARAGVRMLVAHEAATAAKGAVKTEIDRARPGVATTAKARKPSRGKSKAKALTSFPSGHSAGAIAVARAFSREYPEYGAAAIGTASLVAASQVPRCAHYPTDVVAGIVVGLAAETAVDLAWRAADLD